MVRVVAAGAGGSSEGSPRSPPSPSDEVTLDIPPSSPHLQPSTAGTRVRLDTASTSTSAVRVSIAALDAVSDTDSAILAAAESIVPMNVHAKTGVDATGGGHVVRLNGGSGGRTRTTGVQTEVYLPRLPDGSLMGNRPRTARGSHDAVRQRHSNGAVMASRRKSRFALRQNRVGPSHEQGSNGLELDAPKRLQARENRRAQLGTVGLLWHDLKRWWYIKRTRRRDPIPIWRTAIKTIEGHFGTGQASFFVFVRWLFLLNTVQAVAYSCFVVLPMAVRYDYAMANSTFEWSNVFDGQGAVGNSWLFYGGYKSGLPGYRMDLVYILTLIILICGCFYFILYNIAHAIGTTNSSGSLVQLHNRLPFSSLVLASWDYSINSVEGVANLQKGVSNAVEDLFIEEKAKQMDKEAKDSRLRDRLALFGRRIGAWFLWLLLLGGAFTAVWFVVQDKAQDNSGEKNAWDTYGSVVIFSIINGMLPVFVKRLPDIEKYRHPKTILQVTIIRTFLLRMLTVYALLYGYFARTKLNAPQLPAYDDDTRTPQDKCAGTVIGQEIYKLLLVDTVVSIAQRFASTLFFYYYYKRRVELEIVQSVLSLTYRQGLVWAGMVFCPLLPLLACITNVVYFYFYLALVKALCRPPFKRYYSNRNNVFFMFSLFMTLMMVAVPLAWSLWVYNPNCGPYGSERYTSPFDALWEWCKDQPKTFREIVITIANPVIIVMLFVGLSVWITMLKVRLRRRKNMWRETLKELLQLRSDKRFLIAEQSGAVHQPAIAAAAARSSWAEEDEDEHML